MPLPVPKNVDETLALLKAGSYVADRSLATATFLALKLGRPLFLEGEAGVGKTEIAKVLATTMGRRLIRLQCYEGLDVSAAVYEWNYSRQMLEIRLAEATQASRETLEEEITLTWYERGDPLLLHTQPNEVPGRRYGLCTVLVPALGARLTLNGVDAAGKPWPRKREGRPFSTCALAFSESWTEPR